MRCQYSFSGFTVFYDSSVRNKKNSHFNHTVYINSHTKLCGDSTVTVDTMSDNQAV